VIDIFYELQEWDFTHFINNIRIIDIVVYKEKPTRSWAFKIVGRFLYAAGTMICVEMITIIMPTKTGTDVRFTTSNGDSFAIPEQATTTPETGEMVRPRFEAWSIGITR